MGYEAAPATVPVRFKPDHKYHGAEAEVRGMSIAEYLRATGMDGGDGEGVGQTLGRFFESLVSWNLTYNGQPLPPTAESMQWADQALVRAMNNQWIESLMGVADSDPLPESSSSGETSPAPAIPMAPLSESQAS
jgi:hypothetical protein